MPKKVGRPLKSESDSENQARIINATTEMIKSHGADYVTVRRVCEAADVSVGTFYHYFKDKDDLMMYFVRDTLFGEFTIATPLANISDRISELYMHLVNKYMELGESFMRSFYTTSNTSLSAYMCEQDGEFVDNSIMARSERELLKAQDEKVITSDADIHVMSQDICTIVKGCIFEWCLNSNKTDIERTIRRIIRNYLSVYIAL